MAQNDNLLINDVIEKKVYCETDVMKCPNCGSAPHFDPQTGKLVCEHCASEFPIEARPTDEIPYSDVEDIFGDEQWTNELITYKCNSCGSVSLMSKYETAEKCPFCGVTNIVQVEELHTYKPNCVLPFKVTLERAQAAFKQWIKKRLFAPSKFKKSFTPENVRGAYLPSWSFDTKTHARYSGVLGRTETVTTGSGDKRRTTTKTVWFKVAGILAKDYDDLLIEASKSITQKELNAVQPFDTKLAVGFDNSYLAGFSSERYDKDVHRAFGDAKEMIYKEYEKAIMDKHDADKVKSLDIDISYTATTYRYFMLPLWIDNYTYNNKKFRILVNGRSGKVGGRAPLSPIKVGIAVLLAAAIVGVIAYYYYFG